jgi:hypothetical protein
LSSITFLPLMKSILLSTISCGMISDVPIFYPLFLKMLNEFYIKWRTGCNTIILWGGFLHSARDGLEGIRKKL